MNTLLDEHPPYGFGILLKVHRKHLETGFLNISYKAKSFTHILSHPSQEIEAAKERRKKAEAEEDAWESVSTTKSKPRKKKVDSGAAAGEGDTDKSKIQVKIPTDKIGVIIGPGGATLHKLQDATGTRINIPQNDAARSYEREQTVTIEGPEEGTYACSIAIKDLAAKVCGGCVDPCVDRLNIGLNDIVQFSTGADPLTCHQ